MVIRVDIVAEDASLGTATLAAVEHGDMAGRYIDAHHHPAIPDLVAEAAEDARASRAIINMAQ